MGVAANSADKQSQAKCGNFWRDVRKTWRYIKQCKWNLVGYVVVSIIEAIIGAALPIISAQIILDITSNQMEQLIYAALAAFGLLMVTNVGQYLKDLFYRRIYRHVMVEMQIDVARETMKIETSEISRRSSGLFIDRLNNDTRDIAGLFMEYAYWLSQLISNVGVLVAIFVLNRYMFVYCVLTSVAVFVVQQQRIRKQTEVRRKVKKLGEQRTGMIGEMVRGLVDVKGLNATESILNRTGDYIRSVYQQQYKEQKISGRYGVLSRTVQYGSDFLLVVLGAYLCQHGLLTIPSFVIIFNYRSRVKGLLTGVVRIAEFNKQFEVAADRIYEVIDDDTFTKEKFGGVHLDRLSGQIEFDNVSFGYDKDRMVLDNMNFTIKPNERVAFVGRSGAGKTTIFNLITRMYHADGGVVKLDDCDIESLDRPSIRNNMSIITQSPYIFNFSIKENLRIAKSDATLREMRKACRLACIDDYIMSLPDQYDTMVGEGGVILSGGQRQRLAIARALLKKTEIILLDEATSALDNETQSQIQEAINNLQGEYTILIVAHRLSTIVDSDRIFVVDGGKIIADGSHKQLMKTCPYYRDLYSKELEA